jgi:hypothetical protein
MAHGKENPGEGPQEPSCPPKTANCGQGEASPAQPPPADIDLPEGLTAKQAAAVEALLQQPTMLRAATSVGIGERTLRRWMKAPAFKAALQEARRASFSQAIGLTQWYASVAVATLVKVMNDPASPAHCRISAAAVLLRFGREGMELDDMLDRIEALERVVSAAPPSLPGEDVIDVEEEVDEGEDASDGEDPSVEDES